MDVLGEWDSCLKGKQVDTGPPLGPDWEAWSQGEAPRMNRRTASCNDTHTFVRVIDVLVLQVRAPTVPRPSPRGPEPLRPNPPMDAPYLPMEVDVEVHIGPLSVVAFDRRGHQ